MCPLLRKYSYFIIIRSSLILLTKNINYSSILGKHLRLKIEYKSKTIDAFVKVPSDGLNEKINQVSIADNFGVMKIEILFYEEILVQLESKSKWYQFCPKNFYSNLNDEILILEDVSKLGFYMINKYIFFKIFNLNFILTRSHKIKDS